VSAQIGREKQPYFTMTFPLQGVGPLETYSA
jgi:hypothetical protein